MTITYTVIVKHKDGAGKWLQPYQDGTHTIKPHQTKALAREVVESWCMSPRIADHVTLRDLRAHNFPSFTLIRSDIRLHFMRNLDLNLAG